MNNDNITTFRKMRDDHNKSRKINGIMFLVAGLIYIAMGTFWTIHIDNSMRSIAKSVVFSTLGGLFVGFAFPQFSKDRSLSARILNKLIDNEEREVKKIT